MTQEQFKVIQKICDDAPRPFKGNLHVGLDPENGTITIISATRDIPIIDWRIVQNDKFIVTEGDPDSEKYGNVLFTCMNIEALEAYIKGTFALEIAKNYEVFYFNFGTADKYQDTFCRVMVPRSPDAKDVALEKFKAKFGRRMGFQYTYDEYVKFCLLPWWKGTETEMDIEDMEP